MPETSDATKIQQTRAEDVASSPFHNELYVLGHGLSKAGGSFVDAAKDAWEHKGATAAQLGISTIAAGGIGYLMSARGVAGVLGGGFATAAGAAFLLDGVRPWTQAIGDAWNAKTQEDLDKAANKFGNRTGHFAFDTVLMTPTAIGGMYAGGKLAGSRLNLLTAKSESGGVAAAEVAAGEAAVLPGGKDGVIEKLAPGEKPRPYRYVQLDPSSNKVPRFDYGVEVSDPRFLRNQPNLDHHRSTDTSQTLSAAEQALKLPDSELPKPGSVLATIRPDADSVTAMAVLANRLEGRPINTRLVEEIGKRDRISGYRQPPPEDLRDMLDAMQTNVRGPLELHRKVWFAKDVLDGTVNPDLLTRLAERARFKKDSLQQHITDTAVIEPVLQNQLALVKADSSAAINRGYEYGSVVVLHNQNPHFTRFSVAAMDGAPEARYMGWALRELQTIEPGWGGRRNIFGSPQGVDTKLTPEEVLAVVKKYIDPHPAKATYMNIVDFLRASRPLKWVMRAS